MVTKSLKREGLWLKIYMRIWPFLTLIAPNCPNPLMVALIAAHNH